MDTQRIKAFIDVMAASDLEEMEISHDGWTLRLVRRSGAIAADAAVGASRPLDPHVRLRSSRGNDELFVPASSVVPAQVPGSVVPAQAGTQRVASDQHISAPMFGIVHLQSAAGEAPFVKAGDVIEPGALVCTIEAMKVFNEVRAEHGGRVASIVVTSGVEVEAGQALFVIEQVRDV